MKRSIALAFTFLGSMVAWGQKDGDNLGQLELKVTEKYKAQVAEAVKITGRPDFEDTTTLKLPVNYRISGQPIEVIYRPEPISPARIARVPVDELRQGMLKAGYGFYGTPLVEAYWNSGRDSKQSYGFWGQHHSTQTGVEETIFDDNSTSLNSLGGFYNRFYRKMKWESELSANWRKYSYYGIDDYADSTMLPFVGDEERPEPEHNWFRKYQLQTSISAEGKKAMGYLNDLGLRYYNFSDRFGANENRLDLGSAWSLPADDLQLDVDVDLSYFQTSFDTIATGLDSAGFAQVHSYPMGKQGYFTSRIQPSIQTSFAGVLFKLGFNLYGYNRSADSLENKFNLAFFPMASLEYGVVQDVLTAYVRVDGRLRHNTYEHLTNENPYIFPGAELRPTRNTNVQVGLTGIISSTTSFNISGGLQFQKDRSIYYRNPFYRRDTLLGPPSLNLLYDDATVFFVAGELGMNLNDNLQIGLRGRMQQFSMSELAEPYHLPSFTAGLSADYTFREKLKIGTELNFVGSRPAFSNELVSLPAVDAELPAYVDWDLEFEYLYNSRLSAFIKANNLLNQQYDLYLGYKAQSINFLLGFAYRF